jgi:hypothetical protein
MVAGIRAQDPFVVSLSNHERIGSIPVAVRKAHHEREMILTTTGR